MIEHFPQEAQHSDQGIQQELFNTPSEDINKKEYIANVKGAFEQMTYSLESVGVNFSYEFDEKAHDRSTIMNKGWKIVLGRGLDIWQKTNGCYDISEYIQEKRQCKGSEVTFVRL